MAKCKVDIREYPDYYNYGLCSSQGARFCKLDEFKEPELTFIYANISRWLRSKRRKDMITGERYYKNINDIFERKKYFIGRRGEKVENDNISNSKLSHPFFRKLVNQKISYLFGKEIDLMSDNKEYNDILLKDYFNNDFNNLIKLITKEAIVKGIGWLQVYYNEIGELKFKLIPSEEIFPFWEDSTHTELAGIIRTYKVEHFKEDGSLWIIKKAEIYTKKGHWNFTITDGEGNNNVLTGGSNVLETGVIEEDKEKSGHFKLNNVDTNWNKIPFICFKYNEDELSLINYVKPLIDAYDETASDFDNLLKDVPNSIKVIKNYERGQERGEEQDDFTRNLAYFRTIFVRGDGDVKTLETPIDSQAVEAHLKRLKKDIYECGSGVETTHNENYKDNLSGTALQFKYIDLDQDCKIIKNEFRHSLNQLKYFIDTDLIAKHIGDFQKEEYKIIFNDDFLTNETSIIDNLVNLYNNKLITLETAMAINPYVEDQVEELNKLKQEKVEEEELINSNTEKIKVENIKNKPRNNKNNKDGRNIQPSIKQANTGQINRSYEEY